MKGELISKDTILGAPIRKENSPDSYVSFGHGRNFIYNNRYVISGTGNVIDIDTKSLVIEESDYYVDSSGDSLIFRTEKGYWVLDLKTKNYGLVTDKNYRNIKGLLSPDLKHGIEIDNSKSPHTILLCDSTNVCEMIVDDCGFGTKLLRFSSFSPKVATLWLDNFNFVYANCSSNVEIRKVNINTKSNELLGIIDSVPPSILNAGFFIDLNKDLIFACSKGDYMVDQNLKILRVMNEKYHGNHFSSDLKEDKEGVVIRHKNEVIGKLYCKSYGAVTTSGYFAVEYGDPGSNLGYPKGFKVWSVENQAWITVDIPWLCAVTGWIE
ncbi:MAG: hypothetical protein LBD59_10350 [Prevotellaceae bacterium]|nr:hypothetical protein [Prevotellaceae bacterium]